MPKLVLIDWLDSRMNADWTTDPPADKGLICQSVGWLVHDGAEAKTVASSMTVEDTPQRCGEMTIPVCAILHIQLLRDS